ncbi:MAG: NAD(P)-dependent oxidoreductase [Pseudomonadota bacterium]
MRTVLATTSSFGTAAPRAVELLRDAGFAVATNPHSRKLTESELIELLAHHRPIGLLAGTEPVTGAALAAAADHLRAVARVGVGWDNVDREAAERLGIVVSRTEGVLDQAVAELTLGMILDALRHISLHDRDIRRGVWKKRLGRLLSGKTVGVVGFGAIGRRVAGLCRAFGADVVFSDITPISDITAISAEGCRQVELARLLELADIITLHASGNACLLGEAELACCRPGVIVVNTARGGLVDEAALAAALARGAVGCACLDVFGQEPYSGPLGDMDHTVLTAHVGSYAAEARQAMEEAAAKNLLAGLGVAG